MIKRFLQIRYAILKISIMVEQINQNLPLVSVIIPTYNRASWLKGAIDSVLNQTFSNFELLIVDDGSTDNTKELVDSYGDKIKYIFQPNQGPAAARNSGIKNRQVELISFLDSDDRWLKDKLQTQVNLMTADPSIKICYTDEIWIRRGKRVNPKKIHQKYSGWIYQQCLPLCIISPSSVIIHREVFEKVGLFDESLLVCEDYDLWLRVSHHYPIAFINKPLIIKNGGHEDQLSQRLWGMDRFRVKALEKMLQENSLSPEDRKATIAMLHQKCTILANGCFKRSKVDEGNFYLTIKEKYS
jgi:glycosyltransferase involved in cell wall biosynthesis